MLKLLTSNAEIHKAIKDLFANAKTIRCVVAFWGQGADDLVPKSSDASVQIVCNLLKGGTNPKVVAALQKRFKGNIRMDNRLHAKVYWTETGVVLGSANASANGLAFQGDELNAWNEAAILSDDAELIAAVGSWFAVDIWPGAHPFNDADLRRANALWKPRRRARVIEDKSLEDALREGTYADRQMHVVVDTCFESKMQEARSNKLIEKLKVANPTLRKLNLDTWSGYENIPRDATIFDFGSEHGKFWFTAIYRTYAESFDLGRRQFAMELKVTDIGMPKQHLDELIVLVDAYFEIHREEIDEEFGLLISVEEFTRQVLADKNLLTVLRTADRKAAAQVAKRAARLAEKRG